MPAMHRHIVHGTLDRGLRRELVWGSCLAVTYGLAARLGLALLVQPIGLAVMWPPAGLGLAAWLLRRVCDPPMALSNLRAPAAERSLLRTFIDHVLEHIYIKDAAGRYVLTHTANLQLLGVATEEDVVGKTVFGLFPDDMWRARPCNARGSC